MASKVSMSIRTQTAIQQSKDAIRVLWGEEFELPLRHRDPGMLGVVQWEAIAAFLTCKAEQIQMPNVAVVKVQKAPARTRTSRRAVSK